MKNSTRQNERSMISLLICSFLIATSCKILLFPAYRSTDFFVHRHWKAITRHLPMREWYYDDVYVSTRHTLDYPPGFAFLESIWANNRITNLLLQRQILDDNCLRLLDDNEVKESVSDSCVAFMRSTVIIGDIVLWLGAAAMAVVVDCHGGEAGRQIMSGMNLTAFFLTVLNPGLLWLDHVHFQYNGMLLGVLLLSVACLMQANHVEQRCGTPTTISDLYQLVGAALFAVLLTMKHLYLTLAFWYFAYLLRRFCFVDNRFCISRLLLLGIVTIHCLLTPFLPLIMTSTQPATLLKQILTRLFPFGRGLVHDYWAGNVWAIYMVADKVVHQLLKTSLPNVPPWLVAVILLSFLLVGARYAWMAAARRDNKVLLLSLTYSAMASFLTAYHVHEKAILTTLLPLIMLATLDDQFALLLWETTAWGLVGLFPLLFEPRELLLKVSTYIAYMAALYLIVNPAEFMTMAWMRMTMLAVSGIIIVLEIVPMSAWGRMEFVPLAMTSLACAFGLLQCFIRLTVKMMTNRTKHVAKSSPVATSDETSPTAVKADEREDVDYVPPVRIFNDGDTEQFAHLLSVEEMQLIAELILPSGITYCPWKRLYRLSRDGDSFAAFIDAVKGHTRTLLVVRTTKGALLGGFADCEWRNSPRFFGGPSACLYRVSDGVVVPYKWSGINRYIQLCDASNERIAFGGGSDDLGQTSFGLVLERHFQIGTTGRCVTFNNDQLCEESTFAIEDMEVFGFLVGQF